MTLGKVKLYQCGRPLPKSEGEPKALAAKSCCAALRAVVGVGRERKFGGGTEPIASANGPNAVNPNRQCRQCKLHPSCFTPQDCSVPLAPVLSLMAAPRSDKTLSVARPAVLRAIPQNNDDTTQVSDDNV